MTCASAPPLPNSLPASPTITSCYIMMLHKANSPKPHLPLFQLLCLLLSQLVCRVARLRRPPEHRRRRLEAGLEGRQRPTSGHNNNLSPKPLAHGAPSPHHATTTFSITIDMTRKGSDVCPVLEATHLGAQELAQLLPPLDLLCIHDLQHLQVSS